MCSYIPEKKQKGRRNWAGKQAEQQAVYANRRRGRSEYGKSLMRRRGEFAERLGFFQEGDVGVGVGVGVFPEGEEVLVTAASRLGFLYFGGKSLPCVDGGAPTENRLPGSWMNFFMTASFAAPEILAWWDSMRGIGATRRR